jgi:hypothetical protein
LSISSRRSRQPLKALLVYLAASAFCVFFSSVYSLFGHGVRSASMTLLFLYPLLGGAFVYLLVWLFCPAPERIRHSRVSFNLYNAGIATLAVGSALQGVFDIAGTSSPYTVFYAAAGWLFVGIGVLLFVYNAANAHKAGVARDR